MNSRLLLIGSLLLVGIVPAIAQQPVEAPAPSKEFEAFMRSIEGTWKCETKRVAGAAGPDSAETMVKSTIKISKDKDMGGMWYRGDHTIAKSKAAAEKRGVFLMGWDPAGKQVLVSTYSNSGNAALGFGSISGTVLVASGEGYMGGQRTKYQETLTRSDDGTLVQKFEADTGKGMQPMGENSCKK